MLVDAVAHTRLGEKPPAPVDAASGQGNAITPAHGASGLPEARELQELFPELEIMELLGAGGMGAVYKARQVNVDRLVAFKILHPAQDKKSGVLGESEFVERFRREAKAMARLDHPNVVGLYEFGERGGFHFLIMEFVNGVDLQKLMATGKLASSMVLELVPQVCAALHYAHEKGVTHRDIKPANILVDQSGVVKIADFGLARVYRGADSQVALTNAGQVMGTPFYMAPEQLADPEHVDERADIYSLGVVLYQMLTGQLPQGNFSPPSAIQPKLSKAVDKAIMRALAHDPALRFHDVVELQEALEQGNAPKQGAEPFGPHRRAVVFVAVPLLLAGLLLLAFQWQQWNHSTTVPSANSSLVSRQEVLPGMRFFKNINEVPNLRPLPKPRLSPREADAIKALFVNKIWRLPAKGGFAIAFSDNGRATLREYAEEAWCPASWSLLPDGGLVFYGDEAQIYRILDFSSRSEAFAYMVLRDSSDPSLYRINAAAPVSRMTLYQGSITEIDNEHVPKRGRWTGPEELPEIRPVPGIYLDQANLDWITKWFVDRSVETSDKNPLTCNFKPDRTAILSNLDGDGQTRAATWQLLQDGGLAVKTKDQEPIVFLFDFRSPREGTFYRVTESDGTAVFKLDRANPDLRKTIRSDSSGVTKVSASFPGMRLIVTPSEFPPFRPIEGVKLSPEQTQAIEALFVNKIWRQSLQNTEIIVPGGYAIDFQPNGRAFIRRFAQEEWYPGKWKLLTDGGVVFSADDLPDFVRMIDFASTTSGSCFRVSTEPQSPDVYRLDAKNPQTSFVVLHRGGKEELMVGMIPSRGRWENPAELPEVRPVPQMMLTRGELNEITGYFVGHTLITAGVKPLEVTFNENRTATLYNLDGDGQKRTVSWKQLPDGGVSMRIPGKEPHGLLFDFRSRLQGTVYRILEGTTGELKLDEANPGLLKTSIFPSPAGLPPSELQTQPAQPPSPKIKGVSSVSQATKDKPFVNSLGMAFVPVPGTDVLFCIHETRRRDYAAYAETNPNIDILWKDQTLRGFTLTERVEEHPVVFVSWEDATAFCKWLSEKEQKTYRLPTDQEWSLAVGIGDREDPDASPESKSRKIEGVFPWGTVWPPPKGAGNYCDESCKASEVQPPNIWNNPGITHYLDGYDDGFPTTAPVMSFQPNALGIYDLGGNVWEYVGDWWNGAKTEHLIRGGSWVQCNRGNLLSSSRDPKKSPGIRHYDSGFRVVVEGSAK